MASLDTGRVTAGLPALSPSLRFTVAKRESKDHKIRTIHKEIETKRDIAIQPDDDWDRTNLLLAIGTPLPASAIISRLSKLNPSLRIRKHPTLERFQVFVRDDTQPTKECFFCAFEAGYSPELNIPKWTMEEHVEGYGKEANLVKVKVIDPIGFVKGWVPLLVQFVKARLIPKSGAERLFGTIHHAEWKRLK